MAMLGAPCSPCCARCVDCQYRTIFLGYDTGVGECDPRLEFGLGVACGELTGSNYAPRLFFEEALDSVGYNGIVQSLGGNRRTSLGAGPGGSGADLLLTRIQTGYIEEPVFFQGVEISSKFLTESGESRFSIWCSGREPVMQAIIDFSQLYSQRFDQFTQGFTFLRKRRSYFGPAVGVEQILEGGGPVTAVLSWDNLTFGSETIQWTSLTETSTASGPPVDPPSPGDILEEVEPATVQIYDPGRGCCSPTYCDEHNPLP